MASVADTDITSAPEPTPKDIRLVISASSLGTVFEWYDFFIWGTLTASGILQRSFFPPGDELLATLLAWATFAVGFAFRPLGAVLFGYCLVMIAPALLLLAARLLLHDHVAPILTKLEALLSRNANEAIAWVIFFVGLYMVGDSLNALGWY